MSTYGIMKARIADELARSDLSSNIASAVQSAIAFHERKRFYFNEVIGTFSTVASQEWYSSSDASWIATAVDIDSLRVTISGRPFPLDKQTMAKMEEVSAGATMTGTPSDWCYYRQQVRLYPTPNGVYTMTAAYIQRLTALSADADTNAWMTDAEELIRLRAKMMLFRDVIRDEASFREAERLAPFEAEALRALQTETTARGGSRTVLAYSF